MAVFFCSGNTRKGRDFTQSSQETRYLRMATDPIPQLILRMSVPSILAMLVSSIYNMADTYFVGQMAERATHASAAVTLVGPMFIVIQAIGLALGGGASSFISRLLGGNRAKDADRVLSTCFHTAWILGLLLLIFGQIFLTPLLQLLGATEELVDLAIAYATTLLWGAPFFCGSFVLNNALRAEGSVVFSTIGMTVGAVLNIILDPIFIFTLGMGVRGAALATVLCQLLSFLILLSFYLRGKSALSLSPRYFTPKGWVYGNVLKIGIPTFMRNLLGSVSAILINAAAISYGAHALAGLGIVGRFTWLIFSVLIGFAQAYMPVTGFNWGARRYSRVRQCYTFALIMGVGFMTLSSVLVLLLATPIANLLHQDVEVSKIAEQVLRAQALTYPIIGMGTITNMLFESLGRAIPATILSLGRQGLFLIAAVLILPPIFGLEGVIWAQPAADIVFGIVAAPMGISIYRQLKGMQDDPMPLPGETPPAAGAGA